MPNSSLNAEQQVARHLIADTNVSFFLTGRAGTGKTTFLRTVQQECPKQFVVLAPTGIAALLAGGMTVHAMFGFPFSVLTPDIYGKMKHGP